MKVLIHFVEGLIAELDGSEADTAVALRFARVKLPEDKTGTGANGAVNDVAIVWPPGRKPLLMAVYTSESTQTVEC